MLIGFLYLPIPLRYVGLVMTYRPEIGDHFAFFNNGISWILLTDDTTLRLGKTLNIRSIYLDNIRDWMKNAHKL